MKIRVSLYIAAFIALTGFLKNVSAENYMYKWKSTDGEVHYTERPPASGIKYERIKVVSKDKGQNAQKQVKQTQVEEKQQNDSFSGWRKENCKIATQNLDILQNASRIAQDDGQGGTRLMTDEEKQEKIKKMLEQKEKYCQEDSEEK